MAIFIQYNNSHDLETHTDRLQYGYLELNNFEKILNLPIQLTLSGLNGFYHRHDHIIEKTWHLQALSN